MIQIRYAALLAALLVLPGTSFAQGADPDAPAQSGVHKEAGKDVNANADANVEAGAKTQAEIDTEAKASAPAAGDDKPQQQNQSQ